MFLFMTHKEVSAWTDISEGVDVCNKLINLICSDVIFKIPSRVLDKKMHM